MEILTYPHDMLITVCKPVDLVTLQIKEQLEEMLALMYENNGCGLSAPQVGIPLRMLVMNHTGMQETKGDEYIFINPVITSKFGGTAVRPEGCLSLPDEQIDIRRAKRIKFEAWLPRGILITGAFNGIQARVMQHECDHLDGKLIIDYEDS